MRGNAIEHRDFFVGDATGQRRTGRAGPARLSNGRGISWRSELGGGERNRGGGISWTAGWKLKGCDRNLDRRASGVPQAGREGEMHREIGEIVIRENVREERRRTVVVGKEGGGQERESGRGSTGVRGGGTEVEQSSGGDSGGGL